jgi:hypothetical protein
MDWRKIIATVTLMVLTAGLMQAQGAPTPDQLALLNQAFAASYSGPMMDQMYVLAHSSPEVVVADLNQRLAAYPGLVVPGTFLDRVADLYAFAATPSAIDALVQIKAVDPKHLNTIKLLLFYARDRQNPWDLCYYALNEDAATQQAVLDWMTTQVTHPAYYELLASEMAKKYSGTVTQAQLAADPICSKFSPAMLPQLQADIAAVAQQQAPGYTPPDPPPPPTFSPAGGTYTATQSVVLSDATSGTVIRYMTDGSRPSASSPVYSGPIAITSPMTIKAMATAPGFINSDVASAVYVLQAAAPGFSPASGAYVAGQSVTLSDATPGAIIHYTVDGSTPTASSPAYQGPIIINSATTISALATAAGFNNSAAASATYTILPPDFSVSATPGSQSVLGCGSINYAVSIAAVNGFSSNVALSASGLPAGATASFSPASISSAGSSTLTVAATASTPAGNYALSITGTSGALSHTASVTLVVQDFSASAAPALQTITAGGNTSYTISTSAVNGFSGNLALSAGGLPAGAAASFSPASISGAGSSTLTLTTSSATPAGSYTLTITGTSGCRNHNATVTLVVNAAPVPAPSISSLSTTAGPPGTSVTISGVNFGATQGSSTVTFNGTAAKPTAWGASFITAPVPLGATAGNVMVKVGSASSNGVSFTVQDDALHTFAVNCSNCGSQFTDFTIQNSPLYGYVIQSGDTLYFYQKQSAGSVAGITLCFPGGDAALCDDDGHTVDQDGHPIHADTTQGVTHFRKVDLTPSAGLTLTQVIFHSTGQTQPGRWDVYYSGVQIVSANGTVRPIFTTGSTLSLYPYSSAGVTQRGSAIEHSHVW